MSEIPKAYEPQAVEAKWYQFWLDHGCFTADPARVSGGRPAYSIVIPPPNVTGVLTMGHVLNNTIQDLLARKARMDGREVLWLPGTDHAGIATENMVAKQLRKEEKKTKQDLGREEFIQRVWAWKEKHGGIIIQQLKKLGCSCDWTRERFTMDPEYVRCVQRVFVDLYRKGLIYRGKRMVNWCPVSLTALSDEEVVMKEQKGFLYYFRVQVVERDGAPVKITHGPLTPDPSPSGGEGGRRPGEGEVPAFGPETDAEGRTWLTIATTRPETIPADTAVAVNPKDPRYALLIGKHVRRALPPENQALIPIIADEHIDIEFGTGVLKVTPAHDAADFDIGQRHHLPGIDVLNPNGTMNKLAGKDLVGLDRLEARKKAAELLEAADALVKTEPYVNNVGFSERADVPIEPRLSEQWFLKYPSVEQARACVELGKLAGKTAAVVKASGTILAGNDRARLREAAWALARQRGWIGRTFHNDDTGWDILVRRKSLSHAFVSRSPAVIQAVAVLPELIRTAVLWRSEPHQPPNPRFRQVHHFLGAMDLDGELYCVPITVKELADGRMLYDHKAKKAALGGKPLVAHLPKEKLGIQPAPSTAVVNVADLLGAVKGGAGASLRFFPDRWAKVYDHWMANLKDWCISRQLWWGHRIPVWYRGSVLPALSKSTPVVFEDWNRVTGRKASEMRERALALARERGILNADFLNLDTGWKIYVHQSSLEHAFAHRGLANIKLVPALPELLRHAILLYSEPHRPASPDVRAVHVFVAALQLGRAFFRVRFTVKELTGGRKLYDHQTLELWRETNEPGGKYPPEAHPVAGKLAPRPAPGSPVTVADLLLGVKDHDRFVRCQIECPGEGWSQDPDVLDTWFSSWLWPFATMGWTGDKLQDSKNQTLKTFYPTTDLVTGPDIIFFWVARMIMAGYEYMGELPFRNVYFTGIIRDKQGRKMSKSLGNSPDPLDLIARYGADALRFGTMRSAPLGQDILFDEQNVELGRNFCNKLWNACRFRQMQSNAERGMRNAESGDPCAVNHSALRAPRSEFEGEINPALLTSDDRWILLRLDQAIREVTQAFAEYKFSDATATLYRFFWSEYCDWYVEASKAALGGAERGARNAEQTARRANQLAVIDFVLSHTLRLFHPFLPFITEELWQGLGFHRDMPAGQGGRTIMFAPWPKAFSDDEKAWFGLDEAADQVAQARYDLVTLGRNLKAQFNVPAGKRVKFILRPAGALPPAEAEVIKILLNAEPLELVHSDWTPPKGLPVAANALGALYLPLEGLVDFAAERARLTKELERARAEVAKVQEKLANPNFAQKVPAKVLEEHQKRLADWQGKVAQVEQALANLPG